MIRTVFTLVLVIAGALIQPIPEWVGKNTGLPGGSRMLSALLGALLAGGIIFFELRIRQASLKTLIGAAAGSILGIFGASLMGFLITAQSWDGPIKSFLTLSLTLFMAYVGLLVGAAKGDYLDLSALGGILSERTTKLGYKILDTSVIIDGRVADIAEAGFMGGIILIPQFVLRELQQIADSSD
ncbi:MAG: PIN domain nuclease, partial [Acidobacteriota bacterium]